MTTSGRKKHSHRAQQRQGLADPPWEGLPASTASALRPRLSQIADEVIAAIRVAVPAYARPLEGAFGEGLRTGVEQALTQFVDKVEGRTDASPGPEDIYFDLGRGEAREGRTLEALLAAYRVGARVAWRRTAAATRSAGFGADTLALLAEATFAYIDELSARSAEGFAFEQSVLAGETARRRRALVSLLIHVPPAERAAVEVAAREAGWELPSSLAAVVWAEDSDQRVVARLPLGSIGAALDDGTICALVPDAAAPGRRPEVERALGRRPAAIGPAVAWPESWRSAERALAALRLLHENRLPGGRLVAAEERLPELVLHGHGGQLLEELAALRLAPLDGRTPAARARLLETLRAWLDHHGRVSEIAGALHVHPQTVRYRLAQLRELFGDALDDPRGRFELSLAVRAAAGPG